MFKKIVTFIMLVIVVFLCITALFQYLEYSMPNFYEAFNFKKILLARDIKENKVMPFNSSGISKEGVFVQASAEAGVLPAGTTMHLKDVSKTVAENVAKKALNEDINSAQGVDISFHNAQGIEIEPNGYVNVSIKLADSLEGEAFAVIHVPDDATPEYVNRGTSTGANFASDEFSLYVLAGTGTENDPISNVYREYTIGFGESISILSDEKNHYGTWIPGEGNPAWTVADVSGGNVDQLANIQRERGSSDVQPRLVITAKNKTGTIRVAFRYTHPEDRTHKTATGSFIATHYYLIHIVDKSLESYSVLFRNNDGTGISHVGEEDLKFTTEDGVIATRVVKSDFTHTFSISENPSSRAGKITLIMPEYPGNTTRTSGGKTYEFIGWSLSASAIPTGNNQMPIVYPHPDSHIFTPGSKFPLDRNATLWAVWSPIKSMNATFYIRVDDHIPNEPQSHGNASYVQIGNNITYTLPKAQFKTDPVNGVDQGWEESQRQKPWPARVFSDLKSAGKLPDNITNVDEFKARYRIVWTTIKRENDGWHVDGILYVKELYNLAYHENGDLVVVSSMPEGIKDIQESETSPIDTRIPNRYDMVFVGWNTKPDGTGITYLPGSSVVVSEHPELDTPIKTLHLYAQWVKATKYTYTVRYLEAGTNKVLKNHIVYGDQILGNKVYSKLESTKSSSDIKDYVFSYSDPDINSTNNYITITDDNSKNVITLYYMPVEQEILATALFLHKVDSSGNALEGAKFKLTSQENNISTYFTSDKNGVVQIPFTTDPGGTGNVLIYTLIEDEAPSGYEKTEDIYTINIERGQARVVTFPGGISKTVFPLEATVLKNGNKVDTNNITVVNESTPDSIILPIQATKVLEGRKIKAGEFSFSLVDAKGMEISKGVNAADGTIVLGKVEVNQAGTYIYKIYENYGNDREIQYDGSIYTITVNVELGDDNKLKINEVIYEKDGEKVDTIIFTNTVIENDSFAHRGELVDPNKTPKTGDGTNITALIILNILSGLGLAIIVFVRSKSCK